MEHAQSGDGQVPEQTPNPPLWLRLPDGQEIIGRLRGRWQSHDGRWFYDVTLPLWSRTIIAGRDLCEPADVHFTLPATHVEPLEGTSYRGVPVRRHPQAIVRARTGRGHPAPPPTPRPAAAGAPRASRAPDAPAADTGRWKIQQMRRAYDSTGPRRTVIHHQDCWVERGPARLTTTEAVEALRQPGAEPCGECGADRLQT